METKYKPETKIGSTFTFYNNKCYLYGGLTG